MRRAALLIALMLSACAHPTELLLSVEAIAPLSFGLGGDISSLRIEAQPANDDPSLFYYSRTIGLCSPSQAGTMNCQPQEYVNADYQGQLTLPIRFLLSPGESDYSGEVRVWIDAFNPNFSQPRISEGLRFQFVRGQRLWLDVPLYPQCLGITSCQVFDEICNSGKDCQSIQPSLTEPSDDISPGLVDQKPPGDLAAPCGTNGAACCRTGQACAPGLTCGNDFCFTTGSCGVTGGPCCAVDAGPGCTNSADQCVGGSCVRGCTATPTDSCEALGLACVAGVCTGCGQVGQPCCQGSCNAGTLACANQSDMGTVGTCEACGAAANDPCCTAGDMGPCSGALICGTGNRCQSCGSIGAPCCANQACPHTDGGIMATCSNPVSGGTCMQCGEAGACCPAGSSMSAVVAPPSGLLRTMGLLDAPMSRSQPQPAGPSCL